MTIQASDLYDLDYLNREAGRAGLTFAEYMIGSLRHAREAAGENAGYYLAEKARADRWEEIARDQQGSCAGLLCPDCGAEPIKTGHDAECASNERVSRRSEVTDERPVLMGFRDATEAPGHKRVQVLVGRNPGARSNAGTIVLRPDEWPEVREALLRAGFDEMPEIGSVLAQMRAAAGECTRCTARGVELKGGICGTCGDDLRAIAAADAADTGSAR